MKTFISIILLGLALLFSQNIKAIPIIYSNGNQAVKTHDLPADAKIDGKHVNFGVSFKQFSLFYIPLWNYGDTKHALIEDNGNTFYFLEDGDVEYLKEQNIVVEEQPSIPFWHKFGGKLVFFGIIAAFFLYSIFTGKNEDEVKPEDETKPLDSPAN